MEFIEAAPNPSTLNTEQEEEDEDEVNNVQEESRTYPGCSVEQETQASGNSKQPQPPNNIEHKGIKI
jgi:disulfide oxidoreductase YuzD